MQGSTLTAQCSARAVSACRSALERAASCFTSVPPHLCARSRRQETLYVNRQRKPHGEAPKCSTP
eukprot:13288891-Alexandrium_andersonii.AAC.1